MNTSISMRFRQGSLTLRESAAVARKRIKDGLYMIRRHGGWFRPQAQGYTRDLSDAGVFNAAECRRFIDVDGLSVVPIGTIADQVATEIADTERKLSDLRKLQGIIAAAQARNSLRRSHHNGERT